MNVFNNSSSNGSSGSSSKNRVVSCCEYIDYINIIYIIFTLVCIAFWAVDPMTTNMSFASDRFFESKGRELVDSGDGNLDTVINQIGFSILT